MLSLNIIPDNLKKAIKFDRILNILKNYFYVIIILMCLYSIIFMVFKLILTNHFNDTINRSNFMMGKTEDKTGKIRKINVLVGSVERIQSEFVPWSELISYFNKITDQKIKINQLKLNKTDNTVFVAGFAPSRDALLAFKEELEKSPYFTEINFPIKNILEKNNINFEISAKIVSYEFETN